MSACHSRRTIQGYFPQGVASGDPGAHSVMVWTRAQPVTDATFDVELTLQIALDEAFSSILLERDYIARSTSDYTVRVLVEDLEPDTTYFFRFLSGNNESVTGRTITAPDPLSMQPVKLAFVSCQERKHGFYHAYRRMIEDDISADSNDKIQFVLHLGDFIYETRNDPLQTPVDDEYTVMSEDLINEDGSRRTLDSFLDGAITSNGIEYAQSLDDYRQLYREYLSDPDLQAARARWPFVMLWDDHEFSDDCWQTEANYENTGPDSSTNEPSQPRKVSANQAWFEYMPVNLTNPESTDSDLLHSHDFIDTVVGETPNTQINEDNQVVNDDNINAISSLTIYRQLQFGGLLQLILTDNRSYRSDHAIPEDLTGNIDLFISPRVALPIDLQNALDAGRTANNNDPDTFLFLGSIVLNPRRLSPPGTMLGQRQKDWFKQCLLRSNSRWKIWGNSVPLLRLLANLSAVDNNLEDILLSVDTWDGYRSERNELMQFLLDNDIRNVVSLSGDLHAHYAGEVTNDYDDDPSNQQVVLVEAVCGAISSISQFTVVEQLSRRDNPTATESLVRELITYDSTLSTTPGDNRFVNNLNNTLLNGAVAARIAAETNDLDQIDANKDASHNPHLSYADTDVHGYGLATIDSDQMRVELVTIHAINTLDPSAAAKKRVASFIIPHTLQGQTASISSPQFVGAAPFPYDYE